MSGRAVAVWWWLTLSDEVQSCDSTNSLEDSTGLVRGGNDGELQVPSIDCTLGLFCGICGGESSLHLLDGSSTSLK